MKQNRSRSIKIPKAYHSLPDMEGVRRSRRQTKRSARPNPRLVVLTGLFTPKQPCFLTPTTFQYHSFVIPSFPAPSPKLHSSLPSSRNLICQPAACLPARVLHPLNKQPVSLRSTYTTCQATVTNARRAIRVPGQRGLALSSALTTTIPVSTHSHITIFRPY